MRCFSLQRKALNFLIMKKMNYLKHVLFVLLTAACVQAFGQTKPKNVIVLIGDGMAANQILAANYYLTGENDAQVYESFPVKYYMSTYSANLGNTADPAQYNTGYNSDSAWSKFDWVKYRFTDSAPAATSMSTGVKTYNGSIGMDVAKDPLTHISEYATDAGMACGVVTNVQLSHATPAGFVAHNTSRNNYAQIANEMFINSKLLVIMGAGHPLYDDNATIKTSGFQYKYVGGQGTWNNLVAGATTFDSTSMGTNILQDVNGDGNPDAWTLIQDQADFAALATNPTPPLRVAGVIKAASTANQSRGGDNMANPYVVPLNTNIPTLAEMTLGALNVLSAHDDGNGLFLMVEGGAIDWACHANQKGRTIEEMADFNAMVEAVVEWVNDNGGWEENMVIVTGDHETGYITGPNEKDNSPVTNPITNNGEGNMPGMRFNSSEHTNMLIPVFAKGAGTELFALYADEVDPVCGPYINNTEIAQIVIECKSDYQDDAPKNIIFMISDGMGINQVKATDYFMDETQEYEGFDINLHMSTYSAKLADNSNLSSWSKSYNTYYAWNDATYVSKDFTDSAPAATSMAAGYKTYNGSIGVDVDHNAWSNISDLAKSMGKSVGIISSVQFSHATPAGFAVSNVNRNNYAEIARTMLLDKDFDVIMGAGSPMYDNSGALITDPTKRNYNYVGGIEAWDSIVAGKTTFKIAGNFGSSQVKDCNGDGNPDAWTLIQDSIDFVNMANGSTPVRVLGVPKISSTLQQSRPFTGDAAGKDAAFAVPFVNNVPTLLDMTKASLNVLDNNDEGFFLMVEGGAVDWACHANQGGRMIEEQDDFNKSVEAVMEWIENNGGWAENLLIVTGDHETGYLVGENFDPEDMQNTYLAVDKGEGNMPGMQFKSGDHTNMLIPFYAQGAGADIFELYADHDDIELGKYINNTETAQGLFSLWGAAPEITNHAPVLTGSIADKSANEDATFNYTVESTLFEDEETTTFSNFSAVMINAQNKEVALPSWLSLNKTTGAFSGTPTNDHVGTIKIKVTAKDNAMTPVSTTFMLEVVNTNDAPVRNSTLADVQIKVGEAVNVTMPANMFTDVDAGDELTYSAKLSGGASLPAWLSFNATTGAFSGTAAQNGVLSVVLTASDKANATATDTFKVEVLLNDIEQLEGAGIHVYPNPTASILNIETPNAATGKVLILNSQGAIVREAILESENTQLDLSGLQQGVYVLKVVREGKIATGKIMIK